MTPGRSSPARAVARTGRVRLLCMSPKPERKVVEARRTRVERPTAEAPTRGFGRGGHARCDAPAGRQERNPKRQPASRPMPGSKRRTNGRRTRSLNIRLSTCSPKSGQRAGTRPVIFTMRSSHRLRGQSKWPATAGPGLTAIRDAPAAAAGSRRQHTPKSTEFCSGSLFLRGAASRAIEIARQSNSPCSIPPDALFARPEVTDRAAAGRHGVAHGDAVPAGQYARSWSGRRGRGPGFGRPRDRPAHHGSEDHSGSDAARIRSPAGSTALETEPPAGGSVCEHRIPLHTPRERGLDFALVDPRKTSCQPALCNRSITNLSRRASRDCLQGSAAAGILASHTRTSRPPMNSASPRRTGRRSTLR